jgi:alcohol dehydrogenase class IV
MLDLAMADPCHGSNPRPVTRKDIEALYRKSL